MIKVICRTTCWFNRHLYKENQRYTFPDGTKLPHHFEVIEKPKPAPKAEPAPKPKAKAKPKAEVEENQAPKKE
jgi:hypothetical protein